MKYSIITHLLGKHYNYQVYTAQIFGLQFSFLREDLETSLYVRMSRKFDNILVHPSLWCIYQVIKAVQGTCCG